MSRSALGFLLALLLISFMGCGIFPEKVSIDDPRVRALIKSAEAFDRVKYGFSPLPRTGDARLETRPRGGYDAMLHLGGKSSRTIAFLKYPEGYRWVGDQETFEGPKKYTSVDGTFYEHICLTYETHHVSGFPLNRLNVVYRGEYPRLTNRQTLTLDDVKPILKEWGY